MLQKQSIHTFFVTKTIYTPFLSQKEFTHTFFVAKTIYALRPESFCALKVAIRKVHTFWASGASLWQLWENVMEVIVKIEKSSTVFNTVKVYAWQRFIWLLEYTAYFTRVKAGDPFVLSISDQLTTKHLVCRRLALLQG